MNPYEAAKALWHQDKITELRQGLQPVPVRVHFVLSDLCNQNCNFCAYRMDGHPENELFRDEWAQEPNNPKRLVEKQKAVEILEDLAGLGVRAVEFQGGGEPTVHQDLAYLIQVALDLGLDVGLVTNGVLFKEELIEVLALCAWVRFSIDAGRAETYSKIREASPSIFDRVKSNIGRLITARKFARGRVVVGIGYVVTRENWTETVEGIRLARDLGVDLIRFAPVFGEDEHEQASYLESAAQMVDIASSYATDKFKIYNFLRGRYEKPDYGFCAYQNLTSYIGADLNVYRCCMTAYSKRGLIGSIKDQAFTDLWASASKEQDFRSFDASQCGPCRYNQINRTINYILEPDPLHVSFV